jgi:hypothetical protein
MNCAIPHHPPRIAELLANTKRRKLSLSLVLPGVEPSLAGLDQELSLPLSKGLPEVSRVDDGHSQEWINACFPPITAYMLSSFHHNPDNYSTGGTLKQNTLINQPNMNDEIRYRFIPFESRFQDDSPDLLD